MAIEKKYLGQAGVQALAKEIKQDLDVLAAENETKVPKTRKINNKPLSDDVELTADDVGADEAGSASAALASAKAYTETYVQQYVNESILGGAW